MHITAGQSLLQFCIANCKLAMMTNQPIRMYQDQNQPTYLDLFAGCGGISLGVREAGYRCLLAVDADPKAVECYNYNLQGDALGAVQADLSNLWTHDDVARFLQQYNIWPGDCDVVVGGPPCQSFSVVGRTKVRALMEADTTAREEWEQRSLSRVMLFETYVLFIEYLQPRWFLFENVPAIRSHELFGTITDRFHGLRSPDGRLLNYTIAHNNYWASTYGVPQNRRRFLMVGHLPDVVVSPWITPAKSDAPTVGEAIGDLPTIAHGSRINSMEYACAPQNEYQVLMRSAPGGEVVEAIANHHCRTHNADDVALFGRMAPGARFSDPDVQDAIREVNPEHKLLKYSVDKFQDKLHKLDPTRTAWTVTAHLQKDCYKFIHYAQPRTISVREAARLQSFPDRFVFPPALGPAFRLIGNAVPPLLARAFAQSFLNVDPGLTSYYARVRMILPDKDFATLVGSERLRGRRLQFFHAGVAAALLVARGFTWDHAARAVGLRNFHLVEQRFQSWIAKFSSGTFARFKAAAAEPAHSSEQVSMELTAFAAD